MNPGDILDGRYTIVGRLGAGGMGEVYKATHTLLGSSRVIKVVHPNISGNEDARERFLREARIATRVQHPNVATLHDFAVLPDGAHYMVWEFIDGENLAQRLRARGTLPPRQAVRIAIQALHGLEAIHRAGIVHRDISPENLMITADDQVKIIDLGVAKIEDTDAVSQTRTGIFVGKLRYASPEQLGFIAEGEKVDGRADLYAMGMVLVELLTGRPPYEAKSPHEYFLLHAQQLPTMSAELPRTMAGSAALQPVLEKALARDRNTRYATAREFAAALEEIDRSLPDQQQLPTIAAPLDADATMKVSTQQDTLIRQTLKSASAAEPTLRTPMPAAPTVLTPAPIPPQVAATPASGKKIVYVLVALVVIAIAAAALFFWPKQKEAPIVAYRTTTAPAAATNTIAIESAPASTATIEPGQPAQTALTVTSATQAAPPLTTTTAPVPVAATPAPRETPAAPADEPQTTAPAGRRRAAATGLYIEGADRLNDRSLAQLRREIHGLDRVAVRAGGQQLELTRALRQYLPSIEFADYADVVIRFESGNRFRRNSAALATVEKNGRVIFRYPISSGDAPEEFARVFAEAAAE